jgi:hypothetical protein
LQDPPYGIDDAINLWYGCIFKMPRIWHWYFYASQSHNGCRKVPEGMFHDTGRHFGANA